MNQETLKKLLDYNPETGVFTWKIGRHAGKPAGWIEASGYIRMKLGKEQHYAQRLAFLYMTGKFPEHQADHKNHNRKDNRWSNLRAVTHQENQQNISQRSNNKSGANGVRLVDGKWQAGITVNMKRQHLGCYESKADAIEARGKANIKYGFHENHGAVV